MKQHYFVDLENLPSIDRKRFITEEETYPPYHSNKRYIEDQDHSNFLRLQILRYAYQFLSFYSYS
jgi:hypothetical protein